MTYDALVRVLRLSGSYSSTHSSFSYTGVTNQRETTLAWSTSTGKALANAIVWDDGRTSAVLRTLEKKLENEGIWVGEGEEGYERLSKEGEKDGLRRGGKEYLKDV